jgi:hypothetical protein
MCLYSKVWSRLDLGSLKGLSDGRRTHDLHLLRGGNFWRGNVGPENYCILQKSFKKSQALPPARPPSSCRRARGARYAWCLRFWTPATHSRPPAIVDVRRGKTPSQNVRSCDTVRAGAVFPHGQLQVPQQAMRPHRRQPRVGPAGICAHGIVVHPQRRCACFKAWRDRPTHATEPDTSASGRARGSLTDVGCVHGGDPQRPREHQPAGAARQAILTPRHAWAGTRRRPRPLRAC